MNTTMAMVSDHDEALNEFGESNRIYRYTVWITSIQQILSLFGITFNCALVYATVKNKSLHRIYGFLLAICSLCDALTEFATPLATILVFLRHRIPLLTCCHAQFWAAGGAINSYLNLFFISIDRFVALAFPIFYRHHFTKYYGKYAVMANVLSMVLVIYNLFLAYKFAIDHPEIMVYCEPGDMFQGDAYIAANFIMMSFTLTTVFIYIVMGILLKMIKTESATAAGTNNSLKVQQREMTRRIFKSLAVIMAVIFCCWFMAGLANTTIVPMLTAGDPSMQFLVGRLFIQLVTIAGAINLPVLYFCSTEYRTILRKEFRIIRWLSSLHISIKIHTVPTGGGTVGQANATGGGIITVSGHRNQQAQNHHKTGVHRSVANHNSVHPQNQN